MRRPDVVIIGGGFGGLYAARALAHEPVNVTIVDRTNHHLFQPLLYQVATATLAPTDITAPIRWLLRKQRNARVLLGEVSGIDVATKAITYDGTRTLSYDYLIVASGSRHSYFGHPEWEKTAPGLKAIDDAIVIRQRFLLAFERAEVAATEEERRRLLTFVVVGGGPTGVELAGMLPLIARRTLPREYKNIDAASARVILLEGGPRLLPTFAENLGRRAQKDLEELGVEVRTSSIVTAVERGAVLVTPTAPVIPSAPVAPAIPSAPVAPVIPSGARDLHSPADSSVASLARNDGSPADSSVAALARNDGSPADSSIAPLPRNDQRIETETILWAAGNEASPLGAFLGVPRDRAGRVKVEPDLSIPGHPEVFVIGDLADMTSDGKRVPGVAPAAMQSGAHAARNILRLMQRRSTKPFRYRNKGDLATIGRHRAIAQFPGFQVTGHAAWWFWLFLHIMYLAGFRNRVSVLIEWAYSYFTYQRGARLITRRAS